MSEFRTVTANIEYDCTYCEAKQVITVNHYGQYSSVEVAVLYTIIRHMNGHIGELKKKLEGVSDAR